MNKLTFWLIIALFASLVFGGTAFTAAKLNRVTVTQLKAINKELQDSVTTYKNKYGEAVAQKSAVEADLKLLQTTYTEDFKWIKQHMGIQEKDVKGIFSAVTETTGTGVGTVDTVTVTVGEYVLRGIALSDSTEWFKIKGFATPFEFKYDYTSYDHITLVPYREGRNILVRGVSANPNTRITGLQGILVATEPKNKRWGIGPSVQIGYDTELRITPGISVQYSLIRF